MIAFLTAHWSLICYIFGSVAFSSTVSTIVNIYADPDHNPETPPPKWVLPFIVLKNLLALRAGEGRKGMEGIGDGRWTVPLLHYPAVGEPVPSRNGVSPSSLAWLLLPALLLAGCGFGTCLLGKLKSSAQPILVDVAQVLGGANWEAAVAAIAAQEGGDAVNCAVQAIVDYEQKKQATVLALIAKTPLDAPPAARMAPAPNFMLEHGRAWLAKHPATACRDVTPQKVLAAIARSAS